MERFNVAIPTDDDFPQVICAQRYGEGFEKEFVEYVPRWNVDKYGQAVIVDKRTFFALADTADRLERMNTELRELVSDLIPIVCDGCHERLCDMPKEEHPFVECLFADRMRELGVETDV